MTTTTETVDTLNELVLINNDRVAGYEKAIEELQTSNSAVLGNTDLTTLFKTYISTSRDFSQKLAQKVGEYDGDVETGTMTSGKLYRAWMDVKALFQGKDRKTILESCEAGEDAAQKAYKTALENDELDGETRSLITDQQSTLRKAHDEVKALRDAAKNL